MSLTARQREVLDYIQECQDRDGLVPSTREIQARFGFASQTAAMNHLRALERKGAITRRPGKARAVTLASHRPRAALLDIPVFGTIVAGPTELSEQESLESVSVDSQALGISRGTRVFGLKVRGDSMIGAQIRYGDLVILEQKQPKSGDVVAALIDGETTLKRFVLDGAQPFLRAENPKYPEIYPMTELLVQGVMVALIRRCRGDS
jgi:repressor LexA